LYSLDRTANAKERSPFYPLKGLNLAEPLIKKTGANSGHRFPEEAIWL